MAGETILLIDDDATLRELLAAQLHTAGYRTREAADGTIGLRLAAEAAPDLIVLDVMMPGMSGWEVCERLRAPSGAKSRVPIILLTAKGEEFDKLRGFRLGVDDYVTKPFSFAELVARVGAVLTRAQFAQAPTHSLTSGDLSIDFDQKHVDGGWPPDRSHPDRISPARNAGAACAAHGARRDAADRSVGAGIRGRGRAREALHLDAAQQDRSRSRRSEAHPHGAGVWVSV